jgi:hypothetical protein
MLWYNSSFSSIRGTFLSYVSYDANISWPGNRLLQNYLLEPNNFFVEKYPVAMASCLVDITHEVTNKVRLMNPFDHEVEIRQDTGKE